MTCRRRSESSTLNALGDIECGPPCGRSSQGAAAADGDASGRASAARSVATGLVGAGLVGAALGAGRSTHASAPPCASASCTRLTRTYINCGHVAKVGGATFRERQRTCSFWSTSLSSFLAASASGWCSSGTADGRCESSRHWGAVSGSSERRHAHIVGGLMNDEHWTTITSS